MQTNLINPQDQPYAQPNQPFIPPPSGPMDQPYAVPPQPYAAPPQPYAPPPYNPQLPPQQPLPVQPPQAYTTQTGVVVANASNLRDKLCCPRVWMWILFALQIIGTVIYLCMFSVVGIIINVIACIFYFCVANLVSKSSESGDVNTYKKAMWMYIIYFIVEAILDIVTLVLGNFNIFSTLIVGIITIIILCCHVSVFDNQQLPITQQPITPTTL